MTFRLYIYTLWLRENKYTNDLRGTHLKHHILQVKKNEKYCLYLKIAKMVYI